MKNLYLIWNKESNPDERSPRLLRESAEARGVNVIDIHPYEFDFTQSLKLQNGDGIYAISLGQAALEVQKFLLHPNVATFYQNYAASLRPAMAVFKAGMDGAFPIPKTIPFLTRDKQLLKKYADSLGGFPVIVKAIGKSHGVGVMKIDSLQSLYSVMDYLLGTQRGTWLIMAEFIPTTVSARLTVLGNKVLDMIEYVAPKGDFRSNEGKVPNVRARKFSKAIQKTAINTVKAMGVEFGGVDILIAGRKHYVAELNFPCYFPRSQDLTGTDISGAMIDHLIKKSKRLK